VTLQVSVIEDDARLRGIVGGWLNDTQNMRLLSDFHDAETALSTLPSQSPDVVLVDINLPGLDGVECVRRLKPAMPRTQFMMVTVYEDAKRIVDALAAGATGYLLKRVGREQLLEAITEIHSGESPMTSSIARKVAQSFEQAPDSSSEPRAQLAEREQQVLDFIARGYSNKEIADELQVGIPTIRTCVRRIYEKLHVRSRREAAAKYRRA
jgi:DNA-binding NarL/FixJ family response regulator